MKSLLGTLALLFSATVAGQSADEILGALLEAYPYDFSSCESHTAETSECVAPPALQSVRVAANINIEVILDVSGSMAGRIDGQTKYEIATAALREFVTVLPKHVKLALRVYGHEGSNRDHDKTISCQGSSQVYPFQSLNRQSFMDSVMSYQPTGWTALGLSLERALEDFYRFDVEKDNNIIYLLTDGKETCDGDPVAAAQAIANSSVSAIVNAIGFDLDSEDAEAIRAIAEVGGGEFFRANDLDQLVSVFTDQSSWRQWRQHFDCRWKFANTAIAKFQERELDRYNCVLDRAAENTSRIESLLNLDYPDVVDEVMLKVIAIQQDEEEPHYQRYTSDAQFEAYQQELEEINRIRDKMEMD